ncbi:MAG: HEAT repeat domain-containing protein [Armatimonadota bacterium]
MAPTPPSWNEVHLYTARLDSEDPAERRAAAEALAACGERGIDPLCRALSDEDEGVRTAVAHALAQLGLPAIRRLTWRLKTGVSSVSCSAAWALGFCGPAAVEALEWARSSLDPTLRRTVAEALQRLALPECVPVLIRMLRDHDWRVRVAVVRALGEIGDERAVQPLCSALRESLVGGSVVLQAVTGGLMLILAAAVLSGLIYSTIVARIGGLLPAIWIGWAFHAYFNRRRAQGELSRAVAEALVRIGERRPSPELRGVLRDLRLIAADRLQQEPATREALQEAARRIQELTDPFTSLPLPAEPNSSADTLPRPGAVPAPAKQSLPRVR